MTYFLRRLGQFVGFIFLPILFLLSLYLYFDPFKVVGTYRDFSFPHVVTNRDYISVENIRKNQKNLNYNSFIFGSSRTIGLRARSWKKYLGPKDSPVMFDASGESVFGMYSKLKYLDEKKIPIDNALVLICRDVSFSQTKNHKGHLYIKHPAISGESELVFHATFFKAFLSPRFFHKFAWFKFTGQYEPFMTGYIENRRIFIDSLTNDLRNLDQEEELAKDPIHYYKSQQGIFYLRPPNRVDSIKRIGKENLRMLQEMAEIFRRHKTQYSVILSPLYDQIKINPSDLKVLKETFGSNVYDFSGKNPLTEPETNYYESSHFRPHVGDSILKIIFDSRKGKAPKS